MPQLNHYSALSAESILSKTLPHKPVYGRKRILYRETSNVDIPALPLRRSIAIYDLSEDDPLPGQQEQSQ